MSLKGIGKGIGGGAGEIAGGVPGAITKPLVEGAETGLTAGKLAAKQGDELVEVLRTGGPDVAETLAKQLKETFPDALIIPKDSKLVVEMSGMSSTAQAQLRNISKAYGGTGMMDGGNVVWRGVTWKRVGIVAAAGLLAVVIIDPQTGAALSQRVGEIGMAALSPFIPSSVSIASVVCMVSLGFAAMTMLQMR